VSLATIIAMPSSAASRVANSSGPLKAAGNLTAVQYTLDSLATCHVFDGLTILKNTSTKPLRVTAVNAMIPTESAPLKDQITYQLRTFRAGSTTGAVGALVNMPVLGGTVVGNAVGGVIKPISTSSLWYIVLLRIKVVQPHDAEWVIRGLRVSYSVGTKNYSTALRQTVRLPSTTC
jgi:hypothetical protein